MKKYPIINQGIVLDAQTGNKFKFRSFINQPIGWAYLYPEAKDAHYVQMEMELLQSEDHNMPVLFPAKMIKLDNGQEVFMPQRVMPVYWDDEGFPEIACMEISVFCGILMNDLELIDIEDGFEDDHGAMLEVYRKYFDRADAENMRSNQ